MMSLFGNGNNGVGKSVAASPQDKLEGYTLISTVTTDLTSSVQNVVLPQIPNQLGLPLTNILFNINVVDANSGTSAVTAASLETAIQQLILKSKSGEYLFDLRGTRGEFKRWQRLKNPQGQYQAPPSPSIPAGSTGTTNSWNFNIQFPITVSKFPLTPILYLNTQSSRGSSITGTSTVQINMYGDFSAASFVQTALKSKLITNTLTGDVDFSTYLPKGIQVNQVAFDFEADSNLDTTSTFNFRLGTQYLLQNTTYLKLINKEQNVFGGSYAHISGFFPLFVPKYFENDNTKFSANISTVPEIDSNKAINQYYEEIL